MRKFIYGLVVLFTVFSITGGLCFASDDVSAVVIDQPPSGDTIHGSEVGVSISFRSGENKPITSVKVYLDDEFISERNYDQPVVTGSSSFQWDTVRTQNGSHVLKAKIFSGEEYLGMANCQVEVSNETPDIVLPRVAIMNPSEGTVVSGTTEINIDASDNSGKDPYVTIYVNKNLRYMTDRSPYSYNWDTTQETDGPKTIEVTAVDASNNFAKAKAVQVTVRNQAAQASVSKPLSISVASATSASTSATPMAKPLAHETESARTSTETKAPESFEVNQIQKPAASKPQTVAVNPPAPVSIPVVPKPDVKVESTPVPQVARIIPPTTAVSEPTKAPKLVAYTPEFMGGFISKEASQRLMDISPKPTTAVAPKASSKAASGKVYIVQDGESILMIAKKLGVPMKRLIALNNLQDPYLLHIGDKLAVPGPAKMVPIRPAFQATGGTVAWDNVKKEVRATDSQHNVVLKPGSAQAVVNSEKVKMDAPAVIQSGRTLVPGSFITETLGMK